MLNALQLSDEVIRPIRRKFPNDRVEVHEYVCFQDQEE